MDQMMGNLFFRGVTPDEIENMTYRRMKYWNRWHEIMTEAERKAMDVKGKK